MVPFLFADLVAAAAPSLSPTLCAVGAVNLLTLLSAWGARIATGSRYERACQGACLTLLAVTGTLCGVSLHLGPGTAVASAITLMIATLIAVADCGETAGLSDRTA